MLKLRYKGASNINIVDINHRIGLYAHMALGMVNGWHLTTRPRTTVRWLIIRLTLERFISWDLVYETKPAFRIGHHSLTCLFSPWSTFMKDSCHYLPAWSKYVLNSFCYQCHGLLAEFWLSVSTVMNRLDKFMLVVNSGSYINSRWRKAHPLAHLF